MASRFLTATRDGAIIWACIDEAALCTAPTIAERRFAAYLAPFVDEQDARQALLEAGAEPESISGQIKPKRRRRG